MKIIDLASKYGLVFRRASGDSLYYVCPFCDDKSGHLNVAPNKGKEGYFRCNRCGEAGGSIKFEALLTGRTEEEVIEAHRNKKYEQEYEGFKVPRNIKEICENLRGDGVISVSPEVLDAVYRCFLSLLTLNPEHREDLKRRGLSDAAIKAKGYKSLPDVSQATYIPRKLIKMGYKLEGVPGFYKDDGRWAINVYTTGYFVPFVNCDGLMTSLQIRLDEISKKSRYIAFSSVGKPNGAKTSVDAHLVGGYKKRIFLTEGALKADVACYLSYKVYRKKYSYLAIPGVNNNGCLSKCLKKLKDNGVTTIVDAFDMDKVGNETVKCNKRVSDAVAKIKKIVIAEGFKWIDGSWPREKGIDDYLLYTLNQSRKKEG